MRISAKAKTKKKMKVIIWYKEIYRAYAARCWMNWKN